VILAEEENKNDDYIFIINLFIKFFNDFKNIYKAIHINSYHTHKKIIGFWYCNYYKLSDIIY
jgi:hypothetical protein